MHVHDSIILNSQKVKATQMSTDKWMDKQNVVYTHRMEYYSYYSALKRKENLAHAITWMNLENNMLS